MWIYFGERKKYPTIICFGIESFICEQLGSCGFNVILKGNYKYNEDYCVNDVVSLIDQIRGPVILFGKGFGAAIVTKAANLRTVRGVVVESLILNCHDAAKYLMTKIYPVPKFIKKSVFRFLWRQNIRMDIDGSLLIQKAPVLIIYGSGLFFPLEHFNYLCRKLKNSNVNFKVSFAQKEEIAQTISRWQKNYN